MQETSQPLLLNITQVAKALSLSRTTVYKLIDFEGLPVVRFGKAIRVSPRARFVSIEPKKMEPIARLTGVDNLMIRATNL